MKPITYRNNTLRRQPLITSTLLLGSLVVGMAPSTSNAMSRYIQLDVAADKLGALFHGKMLSQAFCPQVFSCQGGAGPNGECAAEKEVWIDHLEMGPAVSFQTSGSDEPQQLDDTISVEAPMLQFAQPVKVVTKTRACIEDPTCNTETTLIQTPLILDVFAKDGQICAKIDPSDNPLLAPSLPADMLQPICADLDLGDTGGSFTNGLEVKALGLSPSADLSRVAFRFELGTDVADPTDIGSRQSDWDTFYDGNHGAGAGLGQFSMFLTERLLREGIGSMLSGVESTDTFIIDAGPDVTWDSFGGPAGKINGQFDAHAVVDECINDIGLSPVDIGLPLSVDGASNSIDVSGTLSWDVSDWDLLVCAMTTGAFDPIASTIIFGVLENAASNLSPDGISLPGGCQSTGDTTFDCSIPVDLPALSLGSGSGVGILDLTGGTAFPQGLALTGDINLILNAEWSPLVMSSGDVGYGIYGGCSSLHTGFEGQIHLSGYGPVCNITQNEDKYNVYNVSTPQGWMPKTIDLDFYPGMAVCDAPDCVPATNLFWDDPYDLIVTAYTAAGAKSIRIPAPDQPTQEQAEKMAFELIEAKVDCMALQTGMFGIPGMYDPHWDIDPPWYDLVMFDDRGELQYVGELEIIEVFGNVLDAETERGALNTRGVTLDLQVQAVITTRSFGNMEVMFNAPLVTDLVPTYDRSGNLTRLDIAEVAQARIDMSRLTDELPSGTTLDLKLDSKSLAIVAATR